MIYAVACLLALLACVAPPLLAQTGERIAVHGSASQGFMYSDANNYLTLPTSSGSFAFTDASLNISARVTDKLRFGAQAYTREIGQLGKGHVIADWALADYRWNDYLGFRAGIVKTVFGLYNDTQDQEALHTWALLPQSLYPLDLRGSSIAHTGVDVYGFLSPGQWGTFSYTAYAGSAPRDNAGGYQYGAAGQGVLISGIHGGIYGADLKWTTPVPGLLLGVGYLSAPQHLSGFNLAYANYPHFDVEKRSPVISAQYVRGNWHFDSEVLQRVTNIDILHYYGSLGPPLVSDHLRERAGYASAAYRANRYLELGAYYGFYFPGHALPLAWGANTDAQRHIFDGALTARFDFLRYWNLKAEGHFMDGTGDPISFHGFYPQDNPQGLKSRTNLLVLRLAFTI